MHRNVAKIPLVSAMVPTQLRPCVARVPARETGFRLELRVKVAHRKEVEPRLYSRVDAMESVYVPRATRGPHAD